MRPSPLSGLLVGVLVLIAVASVAVAIAANGPGGVVPAPAQQVVVRPIDEGGMRDEDRDRRAFRDGGFHRDRR